MIVLDTNVVIYLLEGRIAEVPRDAHVTVSIITEIELRSHDRLDPAGESALRAFLDSVRIAELTTDIKEQSILLRRRHRLTVPDAVIAATAAVVGAELLTNDAKLVGIPGVRSRGVKLKG